MKRLSSYLSQFNSYFIDDSADIEAQRRVALMVILSLVGAATMIVFAGFAYIQDYYPLLIIDTVGSTLLFFNLYLIRKLKRYQWNIYAGMAVLSLLFATLYLTGTMIKTSFVWYYTYPGVAAFLLGSKRGGVAMMLMTLPIFFSIFFGQQFPFLTNYELSFAIRFLGAYVIVSYFAYLFENIAEKNRADLLTFNRNLENTILARTTELVEKNAQLAREVNERLQAETKIAHALKEKEILFREVHHRTKNNMNVIISLLNLQKRALNVEHVQGVFQIMADRIHSMAMVHEQLYQSDDITTISLGEYIEALIRNIRSSQQPNDDTPLVNIHQEKIKIGLEQAIPLGLVMNEIVTNVFKHAIPQDSQLILNIYLHLASSNELQIIVTDNGQGFPDNFKLEEVSSLGLHLAQILIVDQLDGKFAIGPGPGAVFEMSFILDEDSHDNPGKR